MTLCKGFQFDGTPDSISALDRLVSDMVRQANQMQVKLDAQAQQIEEQEARIAALE